MKRQINYVNKNKETIMASFDLVIENGDNVSVANGAQTIKMFFEERIQWANNALHTDGDSAALHPCR
ncbi:MAG: hypothetical protein ACUZ8N_06640 [Candidatus Scalindua sp.]